MAYQKKKYLNIQFILVKVVVVGVCYYLNQRKVPYSVVNICLQFLFQELLKFTFYLLSGMSGAMYCSLLHLSMQVRLGSHR